MVYKKLSNCSTSLANNKKIFVNFYFIILTETCTYCLSCTLWCTLTLTKIVQSHWPHLYFRVTTHIPTIAINACKPTITVHTSKYLAACCHISRWIFFSPTTSITRPASCSSKHHQQKTSHVNRVNCSTVTQYVERRSEIVCVFLPTTLIVQTERSVWCVCVLNEMTCHLDISYGGVSWCYLSRSLTSEGQDVIGQSSWSRIKNVEKGDIFPFPLSSKDAVDCLKR